MLIEDIKIEDCIKAAEEGKEVHINDGQVVIKESAANNE